jgi:hypothetical protein
LDCAVSEPDQPEYGELRLAGNVLLGDDRWRHYGRDADAIPAGGGDGAADAITEILTCRPTQFDFLIATRDEPWPILGTPIAFRLRRYPRLRFSCV